MSGGRWIAGLAAVGFVVLGGCGEEGATADSRTAFSVRDSAGIRIIEVPADAMDAIPHWTLAPEPELEIGVLEGDPNYQFAQIHDVSRLPDGGIAVIDWSPMSIRYFAPDGTFVRSVGNRGTGPGDYRMPIDLEPIEGDSLLVWDESVRRLTVLAPDGSVGRTESVPFMGNEEFLGAADGRALWAVSGVASEEGLRVHAIIGIDPGGTAPDTLFTLDIQLVPIPPEALPNAPNASQPVWDPFPSFAETRDGFLVSSGGPLEVLRLDGTGATMEVFRYDVQRVPVLDGDLDWAIDSLTSYGSDPDRERIYYGIIGVADSLPSIAGLISGVDGGIWIERYPNPPYPFQPPGKKYLSVAPDGTPTAWVAIPAGFSVVEAGPDWVLGVGRDEFDVRYVRRYRFVDAATGAAVGGGG